MLSFWEKESFLSYDIIIIGSGIVGLSTAISVKEKIPDCSVLVLERGIFPTGASTRNAGFACFGSFTEILHDLQHSGPEKTLSVIEKRIQGLEKLRERLGAQLIDYRQVGGYELIFEKDMQLLEQMELVNGLLSGIFPEAVYAIRPELAEKFRFNGNNIKSIVYNPHEGHLHTGKLMKALLQLAQQKGVEIRTGAEVLDLEDTGKGVKMVVKETTRGKITFRARQVAVCTNAFTAALLPEVAISPGRGQVVITRPIKNLAWEGTFHFDEGYYYFRNVGKRVLFGGGRNLAFEEETSTLFQYNTTILSALEQLLREVILPEQDVEIEQHWAGIMGFSADKQSIIKKVSPGIVLGFACNGMGISLGSTTGEEVAEMVVNNE
jgi:gamma-glutamylputrescine oxidase